LEMKHADMLPPISFYRSILGLFTQPSLSFMACISKHHVV